MNTISNCKILIIEDNLPLSESLMINLSEQGFEVAVSTTINQGLELIEPFQPDVVLLDYQLPDGVAIDFLQLMTQKHVFPQIIAMSAQATPENSFELASYGVRAYLQKPVDLQEISKVINKVVSLPPNITPHIKVAVGKAGIRQVEDCVRETMVQEALHRSRGNRSHAANLLRVSRQFLQHVIRNTDA